MTRSPEREKQNRDPVRYYLVGPTGAGKKRVALRIRERLEAEPVSLDSMKIYRGVDVGTATPPEDVRERVPYHLVNIRDPHESFSVAEYIREVERVEEGIRERGRRPLFVGGTGMYLDRLMNGLFEGPEADWSFREGLKEEAEEHGSHTLHDRLRRVDPDRADEIHPNDLRRIIRALEVYEKTGRPMSELQAEAKAEADRYDHRIALLDWPRETLYERINRRVERMMEDGWVEEAEELKNREPPPGKHVLQAAGYREILEYLDGESSREQMLENVKTEHRNLAKRQMTWFRSLEDRLERVELKPDATMEDAVERVLAVLR